jgi:thiol-disulfide isomerase/thioredoxin
VSVGRSIWPFLSLSPLSSPLSPLSLSLVSSCECPCSQVLVHDTFYAATHSEEDRTLVVFYYLSSCPHSMQFRPVFHEVATQLSENEKLVFAEIDLELNPSPPGARVFNFPTVRVLFAGPLSRQVSFVGQRTAEALSAFLHEK